MVKKQKAKARDALLGMIKEQQDSQGHVSREAMEHLARSFSLPLGEVYGVATFYTFLSTKSQGRHVIRVCQSMPCHLKDSGQVVDWISQELCLEPGQTTPDGRFTLEVTNCIGACDQAPAMLIDDVVYGGLDPQKVAQILRSMD
ncbi:MAG: NADH-quinone oxidoreductase subunit NuoE [Desulfarculaceae bacterium]|nr:NADH-quinone oxidoreductase subunit NuoE [Desulfarculaceae bacterium]MCF8048377.1 NADH-quinone oxidoreductase subunit NuoE [Desulfarculaceae bacterium]MCF8066717.1 NADH-quinone oxidoreductase subunit NuoE [Desulfarculaceae bacterium]MCF8099616.1 NADH-quinone oxidoreductase subunit NuoE [Desulfarculaceae bacterium]MCF8124095.1 NADH-quinone oxidoreductase subunit NuoE [Desulfarculaceae bacterium]